MSSKPNDTPSVIFSVRNVFGQLTAPDATPAGAIYRNGVVDAAVTVSVSAFTASRFKASFTIPTSYSAGDSVQAVVTWAVSGTADEFLSPIYVLDSSRIYDITSGSTNARSLVEAYATGEDPATLMATAGYTGALATNLGITNTTVATNLDAKVSTRSTYAGSDTSGTATLLTRVPQTLLFDGAGNIKSNSETVSDKSGYSLATTPPTAAENATAVATAILATPGQRIATDSAGAVTSTAISIETGLTAQGLTTVRSANLDNLDTTISSRLSSSSYIAPDNTDIYLIRNQTDKLQFDVSDNIKSTPQTSVTANNIPTDYQQRGIPVTLPAVVLDNTDLTNIAGSVWNATQSDYVIPGSTGNSLSTGGNTTEILTELEAINSSILSLQSLATSMSAKVYTTDKSLANGSLALLPKDPFTGYPMLTIATGQNDEQLTWTIPVDLTSATLAYVSFVSTTDGSLFGNYPAVISTTTPWTITLSTWPDTTTMLGKYETVAFVTLSNEKLHSTAMSPIIVNVVKYS